MITLPDTIYGRNPALLYVFFGIMCIPFCFATGANGQTMQNFFQEQDIRVEVQTDGGLQITDTRVYTLNAFRTQIPVDVVHNGQGLGELEVYMNGQFLFEAPVIPDHLSDPWLEVSEIESGYVLTEYEGHATLHIFGRLRNPEIVLKYQLDGAVARAGEYAYLELGFGVPDTELEPEEARERPLMRNRRLSVSMAFDAPPTEIAFAGVFTAANGEAIPTLVDLNAPTPYLMMPVVFPSRRPLDTRLLFSLDAVPDLPATAATAAVTRQSLEAEYAAWVERLNQEQLRQQDLAQKRVIAVPIGWLMFFLCIYAFIMRRLHKRKAKKQAEKLNFDKFVTLADIRRLPISVVRALYSADVLQPRNRVHRLVGLALVDLARAGHIRMEIRLPASYLQERMLTSVLGSSAIRKLLPIEVKKLIAQSTIMIQPLPVKEDNSLRPWHKLLLAYVNSQANGKPIRFKELFPTKTGLRAMRDAGGREAQKAEELREILKKLKVTLRESYFEDLTEGLGYFKEQRNGVYIALITVLVAFYLMLIESFFGLFLIVVGLLSLIFAALNRYDYTGEGLRLSRAIRSHINNLMKTKTPDEETTKAEDLLADFLVVNWPRNYNELHSRPYHPLYNSGNADSNTGLDALENIYFSNPDAILEANKIVHFTNFILQEVSLRSLMHYPDFVASESTFLTNLLGKNQKNQKNQDTI